MPNINAVLNEQIRRLSRREIRSNTKIIKRATAHYRRDIAALKRQVHDLTQKLAAMQKIVSKVDSGLTAPPEVLEKARFRADGLKSHRAKLGLSAADYGKLVGVSPLTIYSWEARKSKPRQAQVAKLVAVRGLGKREAMQRLGLGKPEAPEAPVAKKAAKGRRKRGTFKQTAEEMILSMLKGRKSLTTSGINEAWRKGGRAGTADVTLGRMVKAKQLKRNKVKEGRGSLYVAL